MRLRRLFVASIVTVVCLTFALPAAAQFSEAYSTKRGMEERFRLDIGGFFQKFDTLVTIDRSDGSPGTEINLEDVFGQNSHQTNIRLDGYWRFGPHGLLLFSYRGWHRTNSHVIDRDINIGDTTYHAGANVDVDNRVNVFQLYYGYSFVNTGELELGAELGLSGYYTKLSFSASGNVTGPGGSVGVTTGNEDSNFLAPVPGIGGYARYTILQRCFLYATVKGLPTITISGYSGSLIDITAGLDYFFTKNFGLGAGYEYSKITYKNANLTPQVGIEYKYSGPLVYVSVTY
jgi:opacity protein-like surface antigen